MATRILTVGDLRRAIEGLDDVLPVYIEAQAAVDGEIDTLHAVATDVAFRKASTATGIAAFFAGPPVDHLQIEGDGVPEGTCRECVRSDGSHARHCEHYQPESP